MSEVTRGTDGFRTLGELIDLINEEGTPTPAVQALIVYAERVGAAARTHGNALVYEAAMGVPVGEPDLV